MNKKQIENYYKELKQKTKDNRNSVDVACTRVYINKSLINNEIEKTFKKTGIFLNEIEATAKIKRFINQFWIEKMKLNDNYSVFENLITYETKFKESQK